MEIDELWEILKANEVPVTDQLKRVMAALEPKKWISMSDRLPDDSIESFTGGPEGSWGLAVLVVTKCHPQYGIRKLFSYFDSDDSCFYSMGERVEIERWMVGPPAT